MSIEGNLPVAVNELLQEPLVPAITPPVEALGITLLEAEGRIAAVVECCPQSDMYECESLIGLAWSLGTEAEAEVAYAELPLEDTKLLYEALRAHDDVSIPRHRPSLRRVMRPHDRDRYELHEVGARVLVLGLLNKLGEGAQISREELFATAERYGMLPEDPDEQDRFGRIFAYTDGVEVGDDGCVRLAQPKDFHRSGQRLGALVGSRLLDKLELGATPEKVTKHRSARRNSRLSAKQPNSKMAGTGMAVSRITARPTAPKRRPVLLQDLEPFPDPPTEISDEHQCLIEMYKASLEHQVTTILDAAYASWPPARIVTGHMLRMELFMRSYPDMARPILDALLLTDDRFTQYKNRNMFMVVKPEAGDNAMATLRRKIEDQRGLARKTVTSLVHQVAKSRLYYKPFSLEKILTTAARIDPEANLSILYPFLREDDRLRIDKEERWFVRRPQ
jgi:hypothetical protein